MIMIVMIMVMMVMMIMIVVMLVVVLMVSAMSHVRGYRTRQAGGSMGMVVAVPGLGRGRDGRERYSAEGSGGGDSEGQHSFTEHEAYSFNTAS